MMQEVASMLAALVSAAGIAQGYLGLRALEKQQARPRHPPHNFPGVTIIKPLCGAEPLLEESLASFFQQEYPHFQIVFGVHDPSDPASLVVERLQRRYPEVDAVLVANPTLHGRNRKVGNLINCQDRAKHDLLVVADSDVHVSADYLATIVAEFGRSATTGIVTAAYGGLTANRSLAARFGKYQLDSTFLPGVLLGRWLGRQDCLGATMAIHRQTLASIGGFDALADHLDDDNRLGRLVVASGKTVAVMPGIVAVTVPENTLRNLFDHELRWGRTVRMTAPFSYACSVVQYPLSWAAAAIACSGAAWWTLIVLATAWCARSSIASRGERALNSSSDVGPLLLLPREIMSVAVVVASFCGSNVRWRGFEVGIGKRAHGNKTGRQRYVSPEVLP